MYAVEIETDINDSFIQVPEYETLKGKHARVLFMVDETIQTDNINKLSDSLKKFEAFKQKRKTLPNISKAIDITKIDEEMYSDIF